MPVSLLFWGLLTGLWWVALPLALLAALPDILGWRFELALKERQRVADLCTLMIVLAGGWLFLNQPRLGAALIVLIQWMPGLLFPLLAVQLYGRRGGLELSVLFISLRGGPTGSRPGGDALFDLRWSYLLLCVISASMIGSESAWFLPALAVLTGAVLWSTLPEHRRRRRWFSVGVVLSLALALALAAGLRWSHDAAERVVVRWMEQWFGSALDPYRATTAIGEVGRMKGSDRILIRVYPNAPVDGALLLATASYDRYVDGTWFNTGSLFQPVPEGGERRPLIADPPEDQRAVRSVGRIVMLLRRPEGLLPLPLGAISVTGLRGKDLHRNDFGTVRYQTAITESLLNYRVSTSTAGIDASLTLPPSPADERVIGPDTNTLRRLADSLGLAEMSPVEALRTLDRFFQTEFRYSLTLPEVPEGVGPLTHFLEQARSGHCEYFATSAVLLLRAAGIPARYVRGWSVQEYSPLEDAWIGRDSHAHAWVIAHIDGRWTTFDPTPPDWSALEAAYRPWSLGISDFLAWLRLSLSGAAAEDRGDRQWLLLPLAMLVLILAWRIVRRARRGGAGPVQSGRRVTSLAESPFAPLERAAAERGQGRRQDETLLEWAQRLASETTDEHRNHRAPLTQAVELYYRRRFDPLGLDGDASRRLQRLLDACLRSWSRTRS